MKFGMKSLFVIMKKVLMIMRCICIEYLLAVARQSITVIQKPKNSINDINVSSGCKNRPGNSAKHFALSLNSAAIKLIRFRNIHERNNRIIYKKILEILGCITS